ncbi:hypothetical protein K469DRAFT_598522 [Zopfia rhizophila CBS 207.26]|uniref:Aminoglycoside phosphotransferase domain-containing protein n=1 Tax=Zopfia rhizophila CBS 207.26 TaxID=1314779 RepID=A0A6A6DHZ3_9PEZI|nr:hypothetical protein K469DRAFT_598522 [Zopfia rhizophila CBS 207.26]
MLKDQSFAYQRYSAFSRIHLRAQVPFRSIEDMQEWMNERLAKVTKERLDMKRFKLVMCHIDLVRRNVILLADSSVCLFDWAYAGFFL